MPGDQRAHRVRQLRGGLALCLAVLLAIAPVAQLSPTVAFTASAPAYAPDGNAPRGEEPAFEMRGEPPDAGILPRLLHVEGALAPPAQKVLPPKLDASIDPFKPEQATLANDTATGFHRSSVGTARKPTGPPS